MRKVCVVTGTRAEYGLLAPVMRAISASQQLRLQLIATTMHLSDAYGATYREIEADGFVIDAKIDNLVEGEKGTDMAKSAALCSLQLCDAYARLRPDALLLLGDRFETHAAAYTALLMRIPIVHLHGGEVTEGALDEQLRHSITKMASLHFAATEEYRSRILQMGEADDRVFVSGAPGLDNIRTTALLDKEALEASLEWELNYPWVLFTYHPETLGASAQQQIEEILAVIERSGVQVLFTYANADEGGSAVNAAIEAFVHKDPQRFRAYKSLGQQRYLSAMRLCDCVVGNSSSGIIEAASFHKPVVNIGERQAGRLRSGNVIECDTAGLEGALFKALSQEFKNHCKGVENRYGDGHAAEKIVGILERSSFETKKRFVER